MNWFNLKQIDCICNSCGESFKSRTGNDLLCKSCKKKEKEEVNDNEEDYIFF